MSPSARRSHTVEQEVERAGPDQSVKDPSASVASAFTSGWSRRQSSGRCTARMAAGAWSTRAPPWFEAGGRTSAPFVADQQPSHAGLGLGPIARDEDDGHLLSVSLAELVADLWPDMSPSLTFRRTTEDSSGSARSREGPRASDAETLKEVVGPRVLMLAGAI